MNARASAAWIVFPVVMLVSRATGAPGTPMVPGPPRVAWERVYGGPGDDYAGRAIQTRDGGYVVAGSTDSFGAGGFGAFLWRIDTGGDLVWQKTYGGEGGGSSDWVEETDDGGYVLAGIGHGEALLVRTDSTGDLRWLKTYGGATRANCVRETVDGGYVAAGSARTQRGDAYVFRTDADGNLLWEKAFGGEELDDLSELDLTVDGGIIAVGITGGFFIRGGDAYVIRTDSLGNAVWTRTYGGVEGERARSVRAMPDGSFIVAGQTASQGAGGVDLHLLRLDRDGNVIWERAIGGEGSDLAESVARTTDGGHVASGFTDSHGAGLNDVYLVRTDGAGDLVWAGTFGRETNDTSRSVEPTSDGGYLVSAWVYSGLGGSDVGLIKLEAEATLKPGDCNQDRRVDIGDGICLLRNLFGPGSRLPCGKGGLEEPSTRRLLDFNGDGRLDLSDASALFSHFFFGEMPHVLGTDCVYLGDCADLCR